MRRSEGIGFAAKWRQWRKRCICVPEREKGPKKKRQERVRGMKTKTENGEKKGHRKQIVWFRCPPQVCLRGVGGSRKREGGIKTEKERRRTK